MTSEKDPTKRLRDGMKFHTEMQLEWEHTIRNNQSNDEAEREKQITKPSGRRGRIDIFVGGPEGPVAVVEFKASQWDRMTSYAVRRNVGRQAKQIWDYIESQLNEGKEVCPGVIFPQRPKDLARLEEIERLFGEQGIAVVWKDESVAELQDRMGSSSDTSCT